MKKLILLLLILPIIAKANNRYFLIDVNKLKERQEENKYEHVIGPALESEDDKNGQLRLYVRNCGKIIIPKNAKGDKPKAGQSITATLKTRCTISDWK